MVPVPPGPARGQCDGQPGRRHQTPAGSRASLPQLEVTEDRQLIEKWMYLALKKIILLQQ